MRNDTRPGAREGQAPPFNITIEQAVPEHHGIMPEGYRNYHLEYVGLITVGYHWQMVDVRLGVHKTYGDPMIGDLFDAAGVAALEIQAEVAQATSERCGKLELIEFAAFLQSHTDY